MSIPVLTIVYIGTVWGSVWKNQRIPDTAVTKLAAYQISSAVIKIKGCNCSVLHEENVDTKWAL